MVIKEKEKKKKKQNLQNSYLSLPEAQTLVLKQLKLILLFLWLA